MPTKVIKFTAKLNEHQIELFEQTNQEQVRLFNFALNYLYHRFGRDNLNRFLPKGMSGKFLINNIRKLAVKKNILNISNSQISNQILNNLLTNFRLYKNHLFGLDNNLTNKQKQNYFIKFKKPWYFSKRIQFIKDSSKTVVLRIPNNNQTKILHSNTIKIQAFGKIKIKGHFSCYKDRKISLVNLKRHKNGRFELQVTINYETNKSKDLTKSSIGWDWGLKDQSVMIGSNGLKINFNKNTDSRIAILDKKINKLNTRLSKLHHSCYEQLLKTRNKYFVKRSNIIKNELWLIANKIASLSGIVIAENLTSSTMRFNKGKNKGFNRKLALRQPATLLAFLESVCNRTNKLLILVEPYKTSQVDFETKEISKKDLSVREYTNSLGHLIDRDINAAKNIQFWGLNPKQHIAYTTNKIELKKITLLK